MANVTIKEQFPEDIGDGSLTIIYYPNSEDVVIGARQHDHEDGYKAIYLIVDKQELINALNQEV